MSPELGGSQSPKNAEGIRGRSWKDSKIFSEQKTGHPLTVPDNTVQGGSGHDPPREWERTSHLSRLNKSGDCLRSHSVHHRPTTRSDNEENWDELTSEVNRVVKCLAEITAEAIRKVEEGHAETQASIASLNQHINVLRKSYQKQGETSHS